MVLPRGRVHPDQHSITTPGRTSMSEAKDRIGQAVDRLGDELEALSRQIHDHPELAYQEVKAAGWLADFLAKHGFKVERGVGGVETAFRGTIETGSGPAHATLCESEPLPPIGHPRGHKEITAPGPGPRPPPVPL